MTPSAAIHVEWKTMDTPVMHPIARVVTTQGGPMDLVVADPDVTTFLNDRFHPIFRSGGRVPGEPIVPVDTVQFFTAEGCPLTPPLAVRTPAQFIAIGNLLMLAKINAPENSARLSFECPSRAR